MIVSMWMTRQVVTVEPHTPIAEASALMANHRIRRLLVVEKQSQKPPHLVGIVSQGDLLHAYPANVNPFSPEMAGSVAVPLMTAAIMSRHLLTTTPDAPIEVAAELMRNHKIGALPVLQNGSLVGLITESDVFRAFVSLFEAPPGSARITFDTSREDDVFVLIAELGQRHKVRVHSLISSHREDRPICVVRVTGAGLNEFLADVWKSGHPVLNVLRS
jgi:acetoin utilization protein AcuB